MNEQEKKERVLKYYLAECDKRGIDFALFDFEAEYNAGLGFDENITLLHEKLFDKLPQNAKEALTAEIKQQKVLEAAEREKRRLASLNDFGENWELLSRSRSIYILGSVRTGKSCLAFGLAKKLQPFKKVFYYGFPRRDLLKEQGFLALDNLDELSRITDAVVVMDEIALLLKRYEKRNNDELQKILTLAGQNGLTIIFISQISQVVNKTLEGLIDCFIVMDYDYNNLKNGGRAKKMIKDYAVFSPEHFRLEKGQFLYYSRNFPVFDTLTTFPAHPDFTIAWSLAYKNIAGQTKTQRVKNFISSIIWEKCDKNCEKKDCEQKCEKTKNSEGLI